jgi:hypothetical protein
MWFVLAAVVAADKMEIPFTNEVIIDGRSYGKGSEMEPFINQCQSESYEPPLSMGIIKKGSKVSVVGSEVILKMHLRARCESYSVYDYQVGHCHAQHSALHGTITEDMVMNHTIQSFTIEQCGHELSKASSKAASEKAAAKAAAAKAEAKAAIEAAGLR